MTASTWQMGANVFTVDETGLTVSVGIAEINSVECGVDGDRKSSDRSGDVLRRCVRCGGLIEIRHV